MDFELTGEQRMIQESVRRMVDREIQPILRMTWTSRFRRRPCGKSCNCALVKG
jgi:hypothetical protein